MNKPAEPKYPIHTLEKAFQIIEFMKEHSDYKGVTLAEISRQLNLSKSSTHRLLDTMLYYSIVEKTNDPITRYHLGWGLYNAGSVVPSIHPLESSNYKEAVDTLAAEIGQSVSFHICRYNNSIPIYESKTTDYDPVNSLFNRHLPLYASAAGKLFMQNYSEDELVSYFQNTEIRRYTPNTIMNFIDFLDELKTVQKCGYALDNGEYTKDDYSIAMPVRDYTSKTIAAVSVSLGQSTDTIAISKIIPYLKECCSDISSFLGYME